MLHQQHVEVVMMTGDATADVGIAIGTGTDVAVEVGDIVLVRNDPRNIPGIIALSRATNRKMRQNLYGRLSTILSRFLSQGVCRHIRGILLHPAVRAVLAPLSTVLWR